MKVSELKENDLSNEIIDKILFEGMEDNGMSGDCVLVLGSSMATKYRIPKAIEIYNQNRADKILLSGGRLLDKAGNPQTEARLMKAAAVEAGIPDKALLLDEISLTTKENMICSLIPLEREFKLCHVKRILLVTTHYHMRRSLMMAREYFPNWIEIMPCPANDTNTRRHNWHLTERGYTRAKDEACKIISYIKEGSIQDFELGI